MVCGMALFGQAQSDDHKRVKAEGFTVDCPKDWEVQSTGGGAIALIGIAPLENSQDRFRENLTIARTKLNGKSPTATEFGKADMAKILKPLKEKNVIKEETYTKDGLECYRIMYSGIQGELHLRYEQRYFVKDGIAYTLNVAGEKENYHRYGRVFTEVLDSFKLD